MDNEQQTLNGGDKRRNELYARRLALFSLSTSSDHGYDTVTASGAGGGHKRNKSSSRFRMFSESPSMEDSFSTLPPSPTTGDRRVTPQPLSSFQKTQERLRTISQVHKLRTSTSTFKWLISQSLVSGESSRPYDQVVNINVSGMIFSVYKSTLMRHPGTLLADSDNLEEYYIPDRNMYFFDRPRLPFAAILSFYQNGEVRRPPSVSIKTFLRELDFFRIKGDAFDRFIRSICGCFRQKVYRLQSNPTFKAFHLHIR
ncbi:hypothetical protein ACOME3_001621 [Neoechinorhynchus agilis]